MTKMTILHLAVGALGLLAFVLQGQLMANSLAVSTLEDGTRMMYRTAHIYLMLASVSNILMALIRRVPASGWQGIVVNLCSLAFLVAPFVFSLSFFVESTDADFERPLAALTLYGMFGAGTLLLLLTLFTEWRSGEERS